jgi:hypothetical protein
MDRWKKREDEIERRGQDKQLVGEIERKRRKLIENR